VPITQRNCQFVMKSFQVTKMHPHEFLRRQSISSSKSEPARRYTGLPYKSSPVSFMDQRYWACHL
jgi:hypothetical protein